jgi:hypothetical protein
MALEKIHILPTDHTPEVIFNPSGTFKLKGRGLVLNKTSFPEHIMNWIRAYVENPAEETYVIIAFEYLNSFTVAILVSFLKEISKVLFKSKKLFIHWYYKENDDDVLERCEHVLGIIYVLMKFIMSDDISEG